MVDLHRPAPAGGGPRRTKRYERKGWAAVRFSSRKQVLGAAAAVLAVLIPASLAWGCVVVAAIKVNGSGVVQPGGTVEVFGSDFARGKPVHFRLNSPDGRILQTEPNPQPSTMTSQLTVQVPIPQDVSPGAHVLFATQEHYDMNVGIPARATIYVNSSPPVAPLPTDRVAALEVSDEPSAASYVLIGLGVAVLALLVAAAARAIAARPPSAGGAEGVKTS